MTNKNDKVEHQRHIYRLELRALKWIMAVMLIRTVVIASSFISYHEYTFTFYCKMFFTFVGKEEIRVFLSDSHADDDAFEIGKTTIARSRYD